MAWENGPPWRLRLCVEPDDKHQRWLLEGQLVRETAAPVALKTPAWWLPTGWCCSTIGCRDWSRRLRGVDLGFAQMHFDHGSLPGPLGAAPAALALPSLPEVRFPANLRCEELRVPPQGRLIVRAPQPYRRNRLDADVLFQYEQKLSAAERSAGIVDVEQKRVVVRDHRREGELLAFLAAQGVRAETVLRAVPRCRVPQQRLADVVGALLR